MAIRANPANMATAASGISGALTGAVQGHPVHPPLGGDPVSLGAAARLSSGALNLALHVAGLAVGLADTSAWFATAGISTDVINESAAVALATLRAGAVSGPLPVAPVFPPVTVPDVRPPLPPPGPVPANVASRALHQGDPSSGEGFASSWTQVGYALDEAAGTVKRLIDTLPEHYESERVTPRLVAHLTSYHRALGEASHRAHKLSTQAQQHRVDVVQARQTIPTPQQFDEADQRLQNAVALNARTGGRYTPAVLRLTDERRGLETKGTQGVAQFHFASVRTTGTDPDEPGPGEPRDGNPAGSPDDPKPTGTGQPTEGTGTPTDPQGLPVGPDGVPVGPDGLPLDDSTQDPASPMGMEQIASLLPTLIPTILSGVTGGLGQLLSSVSAGPQALLQAASQAAQIGSQALDGIKGDEDLGDSPESPGDFGDLGGPGTGTSPAGGTDAPTLPAPVSPSAPTVAPTIPAGAGAGPAAAAPAGGMPMMPMSPGMMGGAGAGGGQQSKARKPNTVTPPAVPHSEAVTGKVSEDRIVTAGGVSSEPDAADDGDGGGSGGRRFTVRKVSAIPIGGDKS